MGPFEDISSDQVTSLHVMIRFLRRLGCCGKLSTTTMSAEKNVPISAISFSTRDRHLHRYSVRYDGYDPSRYEMQIEIELEKVFGEKLKTDPWMVHFKF